MWEGEENRGGGYEKWDVNMQAFAAVCGPHMDHDGCDRQDKYQITDLLLFCDSLCSIGCSVSIEYDKDDIPWDQKKSQALFRGGNRVSMFFENREDASR